eukprot:COSAG05_NODE_3621_length_1955_cov_2.756466_5_plen_26_part_01
MHFVTFIRVDFHDNVGNILTAMSMHA